MRGRKRLRKKKAIGTHRNRIDPRMQICPGCLGGVGGYGVLYRHGNNYYECPQLTLCIDCDVQELSIHAWLRRWRGVGKGRSVARKILIHRFGWLP